MISRLRRLASFVVVLTVLAGSVHAGSVVARVPPRPVGPDGRVAVTEAFLPGATPQLLARLTALGFVLERTGPLEAIAYLSADEIDKLAALGILWVPLPPTTAAAPEPDAAYTNYTALTARLQQLANDHPSIVRISSAGLSVQGRELWWVKITDNPDVEEDEPGFRYISTMHGDEPVGTELLLSLVDFLTGGYGTDPRATRLVDGVEIWIMPMMNPDGNTLSQRFNRDGVDLNRDFPDQWTDPSDTTEGRAPETVAVMNWQRVHTTMLSANLHTGALVVNYPYDSNESGQPVYSATPDDDIMVDVSLDYSEDNAPMYASSSFSQGITNGADWYIARGGLQDWSYVYRGDIDLTLELSNTKWPPASQLEALWDDNRESLLSYLERVLTGVRGVVTDAETGAPVTARVTVAGRDIAFYTDPEVGDYQRILEPGTHTLRFEADGYETAQVPVTVTSWRGDAARLDVALVPGAQRLEHASHRIADDSGGDGFLDAGESGHIAITLGNEGRLATGVTGTLVPVSVHAIGGSSGNWADIAPGGAVESNTPHLAFASSPDAPPGNQLGYVVRWQSAEGKSGETSPFFVPLGATSVSERPAVDVPKSIVDNVTSSSTLVVTDDRDIAEVDVRVDISHPYIGDLRVWLESPQGTVVRLHERQGGSANDIRTWYDDETVPVDDLGAFRGEASGGTWTLRVRDEASGDEGQLLGWTLRFATRPFEDPVAETILHGVVLESDGAVTLRWWPVGGVSAYRVYRSNDPSSESSFADATGEDDDDADTAFVDRSQGALTCWIIAAVGRTGEGLWGHFGR